MKEEQNERVAGMHEKSKKIISELTQIKEEIDTIQNSSLTISENDLETVKKIKDELGLSDRVGTWPVSGPGSDSCHWCTAGSGA